MSQRLTGQNSRPWTLYARAAHARGFPWRDCRKDCRMREADYSIEPQTLFTPCEKPRGGGIHGGSSGRTCRDASAPIEGWILKPYSKPSARPNFQCLTIEPGRRREWSEAEEVFAILRGERWMLNFSMLPNDAKECFLWQILEPDADVPTKYSLSERACQGILRRAARKKKELQPQLRAILEKRAGEPPIPSTFK